MLSHAILLLLLCASVADAEGCGFSFRAGMKMPKDTWTVRCKVPGEFLNLNSKWYESVKCVNQVWIGKLKDETGQLSEEKFDYNFPNFWCKTFSTGIPTTTVPATHQDKSCRLIDDKFPHRYHNQASSLRIHSQCLNRVFAGLTGMMINSEVYWFLTCNHHEYTYVDGWRGTKGIPINLTSGEEKSVNWKTNIWIADTSTPLHFKCIEYCTFTTFTGGIEWKAHSEPDYIDVFCRYSDMFYGEQMVKNVKCAHNAGWWIDGGTLLRRDTATPIQFECRKDGKALPQIPTQPTSRAPCDYNWNDKAIKQYGYDQNYYGRLACEQSGRFPMAIVFNTIRYKFVGCNDNYGWRGSKPTWNTDRGQLEQWDNAIAQTYSFPQLSCAEYCTFTGTGVEIVSTSGDAICSDPDLQVFYGTRRVRKAWCALDMGWNDKYGFFTQDTATPLQLECRREGEAPKITATTPARTPETPATPRIPIVPKTSRTPEATTTTTLPPPLTVPEKKPNDNKSAASKDDAPGVASATIAGCLTGGIIFIFVIVGVVIFFLVKKRQNEDGREARDGERTKEYNDEIPDETNIESQSELNV